MEEKERGLQGGDGSTEKLYGGEGENPGGLGFLEEERKSEGENSKFWLSTQRRETY